MITKTVIKDYVNKRCPYLVSLELEDKSLVALLKKSIANKEKYRELAEEEGEDSDDAFDLYETLKDYPYLKKEIEEFEKTINKNPAEQLIDKYGEIFNHCLDEIIMDFMNITDEEMIEWIETVTIIYPDAIGEYYLNYFKTLKLDLSSIIENIKTR